MFKGQPLSTQKLITSKKPADIAVQGQLYTVQQQMSYANGQSLQFLLYTDNVSMWMSAPTPHVY